MRRSRIILPWLAALATLVCGMGQRVQAAPPQIGINLGSIQDWGADFAFADAIKQSRFWRDAATGNNYNIGDSNGWPTMDATCGVWYGNQWAAITVDPMDGTYGLSFNGKAANISAMNGTISNQVYNAATNTTTATLTMTNNFLELTFTGTQRTSASATNTGITNVKLMRPTAEHGTTPYATNVTFQPAYEALLSYFSVLRFMDWDHTNWSPTVNWSDRTRPSYFSQTTVAWEYCVQIANDTNKDIWVNIPAQANDDYVTKLAQLIKYGSDGTNPYTSTQASPVWPPLNAGLHCYVEFSNEVWNFSFGQYGQVLAAGDAEIHTYPVSANGLGQSVTNGPLSSVGGFSNGVTNNGYPGEFPNGTTVTNPNYFRDVVFSNGSNTSVFTNQTPAATSGDSGAGDELGMKFTSSQAGQITAVKYYKVPGETGTHVGNVWSIGGVDGSQAASLMSGGGTSSIAQAVNFPATGSYTIKFYGCTTPGTPNPTIQVSVDGVNVGGAIVLGSGFSQYTSAGFNISSAGSHTIMLSNASSGSAYIDLVTVQGAGAVTVTNNSFESPTYNPNGWQGPTSWTTTGYTIVQADPGATLFVKKLGSATYTNETASGWQQATLSPSVSIAANMTYVVSTNSNSVYGLTSTTQIGPLSWDGNMGDGFRRKWVERAIQISNTFRTIWGDSAMPGTSSNPIIRPLLESTQGWYDNFTAGQISYLQNYFNNPLALAAMPDGSITSARPPSYYFYGGGAAAYYSPNSGIDINSIWTSGDMNPATFGTHDDPVVNYALPSLGRRIAYEGGPGLDQCNCPDDAVKQQAWGDPRITTALVNHQIAYNQNGGDLLVYFDTAEPNYQWAFVSDIFNLNTPKMDGVRQINASTKAVGTYGSGISGGATIPANTTVPAFLAPNLTNMSASVNHSDFAGYVVSSSSAAAFNIALSAGSSGTGNSADIYFDGVLAGTVNIPNSGSNTTFQNTSAVTTPNVPAGSHGVMVKVHAGSFGLNNLQFSGGIATIPSAPTGLAATATYQQVNLTWTGSIGATSYNIYRGTSAGGENGTPVATGVSATSYSNTGLVNGTTYYFKVAAVNSAGTSGMSNEASGTPVDNTGHFVQTATAPTIDGTVDSVWSNAPQNTISHLFNGPIPTGQTFSAKWQGLWDNTNLYILVQVTNNEPLISNSSSPWLSDSVELYVDATDARPSTYQATDFQYELGYGLATAQETKHSPGSLTGVIYSYKPVSGGWVAEASIPWSTLGVTPSANKLIGADVDVNDGFNTGNTKLFWWNTDNTDWSTPSSFGTGLLQASGGSAPPAPTGLTATAGNTQVALSWTASSGATSYNVKRSTVSGSGYTTVSGPATTSYTNTGLTNGTTYYYVVTAVNAAGESPNSNQASATPNQGTRISIDFVGGGTNGNPANMSAAETAGVVSVANWNNATGGSSAGALSLFDNVAASTGATATWTSPNAWSTTITDTAGNARMMKGYLDANGTAASVTIAGLPGVYTTNGYDVYVYCDGDNGTATRTGRYVIGTTTITATDNASTDFGGTFTQAVNSAGNYVVFTNLTGTGFTLNATGTVSSDGALRAPVNGIQIVAHASALPAAPTGLTATAGNTQVVLTWTASTGATSYNVKRSTISGSGYATVSSPTTTSYTNTGLSNATTYYYVVSAVNTGGESVNSSQVSAPPVAGGATLPIQINAAGPLVSPFVADVDFSGGSTFDWGAIAIDTSGATSPAPAQVYTTERWGNSTYTIPGLTSGTSYTVRLHFCENNFTASGKRSFNVAINGTAVLSAFDIYAAAGAAHKAVIKQFTATANTSGQIVVALTNGSLDNASINGIEIQSASSLPTPIILLGLNEGTGTTTANAGSAGGSLNLTATTPAWSANVPANVGGAKSVDFGTTVGNFAVESGAPVSALGGLSKFTITGWVNNKSATVGAGGNRIVTWINNGGNGADLVYNADGSLTLGVNAWPDSSPAKSSAGKVTTDAAASAGNWRFFAVTYDGTLSTNNVTWYFGTNTAAATADVTNTYAKGTVGTGIANLALGNFNTATRNSTTWDRMFRGLIDDVKVYGAVLTPSQVQTVQGTTAGTGAVLSRTGWVASASLNSGSANSAIDTDTASGWQTNANQANGQWFQVDMGAAKTFNKVTIDAGTFTGDYPRGYQVFVSNDGATWGTAVATGSPATQLVTATFATQTARYIRVVQTGTAANNWWTITDFNAYF